MIIQIGADYYRVRGIDPGILRPEDKGLRRCHKVKQDWNGNWYCCDDDDYLVDDEGKIVAKESENSVRKPYKNHI